MKRNNKLIVDSHILIWDMMGHPNFAKKYVDIFKTLQDQLYICSITFWEIGLLVGKGSLHLNVPVHIFLNDAMRFRNYKVLEITPIIANHVSIFSEQINGDPADRIIAATTMVHEATLLTADENLKQLPFLQTL